MRPNNNSRSCANVISSLLLALLCTMLLSCGGGGSGSDDDGKDKPGPGENPDDPQAGNKPPLVSIEDDFSTTVADYVLLHASASDGDGDALSYQWSADASNPSVVSMDNALSNESGFFASPDLAAGVYTFTIAVTDGKDSVSRSIKITVEQFRETSAADVGLTGNVSFGSDVALSQDSGTYVIGSELANGTKGNIYVGRKNSAGNYETFTLCPSDISSNNRIGTRVAVSGDGNTVLASTTYFDSYRGKVYVYEWDGSQWNYSGVQPTDLQSNDMFGAELAVNHDGTAFVVHSFDGNNNMAGKVYLFKKNASTWIETLLDQGDSVNGAGTIRILGRSLAISQDASTIIAGAHGSHNGYVNNGGALKVYTWNGTAYNAETIYNDDYSPSTGYDVNFGYAVALRPDGKAFVASARRYNNETGRVYLYEKDTDDHWNISATLQPSNGMKNQMFGSTVQISTTGSTIAVGAGNFDGEKGAMYLFRRSGSAYDEYRCCDPNGIAYDYFGTDIAISGDGENLLVSAPGKNSKAGSVFWY